MFGRNRRKAKKAAKKAAEEVGDVVFDVTVNSAGGCLDVFSVIFLVGALVSAGLVRMV